MLPSRSLGPPVAPPLPLCALAATVCAILQGNLLPLPPPYPWGSSHPPLVEHCTSRGQCVRPGSLGPTGAGILRFPPVRPRNRPESPDFRPSLLRNKLGPTRKGPALLRHRFCAFRPFSGPEPDSEGRVLRVVALGADGGVEEERVGKFVRGGDAVAVVDVPEDVERGPDGLEPPGAAAPGRIDDALPTAQACRLFQVRSSMLNVEC